MARVKYMIYTWTTTSNIEWGEQQHPTPSNPKAFATVKFNQALPIW